MKLLQSKKRRICFTKNVTRRTWANRYFATLIAGNFPRNSAILYPTTFTSYAKGVVKQRCFTTRLAPYCTRTDFRVSIYKPRHKAQDTPTVLSAVLLITGDKNDVFPRFALVNITYVHGIFSRSNRRIKRSDPKSPLQRSFQIFLATSDSKAQSSNFFL